MIISTIIQAVCLITIALELLDIYKFFRGCKKVRCTVVSSKKIIRRRSGFLTDEFFRTRISFTNNGKALKAILRTSTFCPAGQQIDCYYHTGKHIIFRKRDLRKNIGSSSLIKLSVSILFVVLNSLFGISAIGRMILDNIINILSWTLAAVFFFTGTFLIVYAAYAVQSYRNKDIIKINAVIQDVVMKTSRYNEIRHYTYYPIYSYSYNGINHTVRSKKKLHTPPVKGSTVVIRLSKRKGCPVEFNDVGASFAEGICFYIITACFIAVQWFYILPI